MDAVKILGSLLNQNALGSKTGGNILESLLGGGAPRGKAPSTSGNPTDILSTLLGGKKRSGKGGFAALAALAAVALAARGKNGGGTGGGDLLGSLLGEARGKGGSATGPDLGDLFGGLLGSDVKGGSSPGGGLLGSLLGGGSDARSGLSSSETPPPLDSAEAEKEARLLVEAMCQAAKSDGHVDEQEREAILGKLGDLDPDEAAFLREQLSSPVNLESFVRRVPADMTEQVYAFSLMAVRLDSRKEAEFFEKLARGLGLEGREANEIHARLGQPEIFT